MISNAMASAKKRSRSENWLDRDKILLTDLVKERYLQIENKNNDTTTNTLKTAAWNDLKERFNLMCHGSQRTVTQLRCQWGHLKMQRNKIGTLNSPYLPKADGAQPIMDNINSDESSNSELDLDDTNLITVEQPSTLPQHLLSLELDPLENIKEKVIIVPPMESPSSVLQPLPPKPSNIRRKKYRKITGRSPAEQVAACEIKCRTELHAIQMRNERQKQINLGLKEVLIKEIIKFYKQKNK